MKNEELEILYNLYKSLNVLQELLSSFDDDFCQNICRKILELNVLLSDESLQKGLNTEHVINKLQEINELLLMFNYRSSFIQLANPTCEKFKEEIKEYVNSLEVFSLHNEIRTINMN